MRPARRNDHFVSSKSPPGPRSFRIAPIIDSNLGHPAPSHVPGRQPPFLRADERVPRERNVSRCCLRGRVLPHLRVHRRATTIGAPVASAVRLTISSARPSAMRAIIVAVAGAMISRSAAAPARRATQRHPSPGPTCRSNTAPRHALERDRRDELRGLRSHHDVDQRAGLRQFARKVTRLVDGDAASHTQDDVLVGQVVQRISLFKS